MTPFHSLSHLIIPYPLSWEQNCFHLATLIIIPRPHFFNYIISRLVIPYHNLSHYPLGWKQNQFHLPTLKLVRRPLMYYQIFLRFATPFHTLAHLIH